MQSQKDAGNYLPGQVSLTDSDNPGSSFFKPLKIVQNILFSLCSAFFLPFSCREHSKGGGGSCGGRCVLQDLLAAGEATFF